MYNGVLARGMREIGMAAPQTTIPKRGPDPRALVVAQRAQDRTPGQVFLFGSRARGDWKDDSDIDLMVIEEDLPRSRRRELTNLSARLTLNAVDLYPDREPVPVQLLYLTRAEFEQARRAPTHVAGGVQRDGLTPSGQSLPPVVQNEPWAAVRNFLKRSFTALAFALKHEGDGAHLDAALSGFHAFELTLKAYASALGYAKDDMQFHNLNRLIGWIRNVENAVDFTHTNPDWCLEMQNLRRHGPYEDTFELFREADDLIDTVQQVGSAVVARTLALSHRTPSDVGYAYVTEDTGFPDINLNRSWGGLEDAYPYRFSVHYQIARARAEALLQIAQSMYGDAGVEHLRSCLDQDHVDAWPSIDDVLQGHWVPNLEAEEQPDSPPDAGSETSTGPL